MSLEIINYWNKEGGRGMISKGIVDVPGIKVGHAEDQGARTGCTVILCEGGAVAGVDIRGGAPGSRETALLDPINMVDKVHGILLTGGSAFGLEAANGVMQYLEEREVGFDVGVTHVPIVPASVLFDLTVGDYKIRPDGKMGYSACLNANLQEYRQGSIGAGTGATVGKIMGQSFSMKGGIGTWSIQLGDIVVGAIVAVNAIGDIVNPTDNRIIAGARNLDGNSFINTIQYMKTSPVLKQNTFMENTTLGVIATNVALTKAEAKKVSSMTHNAYARVIRPVHTQLDGDTIYTLSTGFVRADINVIGLLAMEAMEAAILQAVMVSNSKAD